MSSRTTRGLAVGAAALYHSSRDRVCAMDEWQAAPRGSGAGTIDIVAPEGPLRLVAREYGWYPGETELLVPAGGGEIELPPLPARGVAVRCVDGEPPIPLDARPVVLRPIDGDGEVVCTRHVPGGREVLVDAPGRYLLSVPTSYGYESVPDVEVVVPARGVVAVERPLVRAR